jgi:ral guanine nucleotide dissociation stimulator-like 1
MSNIKRKIRFTTFFSYKF